MNFQKKSKCALLLSVRTYSPSRDQDTERVGKFKSIHVYSVSSVPQIEYVLKIVNLAYNK